MFLGGLVESLGFSIYKIMSPVIRDNFIFSFTIWAPFSFSCLIALTRTSSTMLNRRGESGHYCGSCQHSKTEDRGHSLESALKNLQQ